MNREEHLDAIVCTIDCKLAVAAKRTPGEWLINQTQSTTVCDNDRECTIAATRGPWPKYQHAEADAAYIAACSNAAEAGWRATKEAIVGLRILQTVSLSPCDGGSCMVATEADDFIQGTIAATLDAIRAQWPEHLLTSSPGSSPGSSAASQPSPPAPGA